MSTKQEMLLTKGFLDWYNDKNNTDFIADSIEQEHFADSICFSKSNPKNKFYVQIRFTDEEMQRDMGQKRSHGKWSDHSGRTFKDIVNAVFKKSHKYSSQDKEKTILLLIGSILFDNREWINELKPSLKELKKDTGFKGIFFTTDDGKGIYFEEL